MTYIEPEAMSATTERIGEQVKTAINAVDFDPIKVKLIAEHGWTREYSEMVEEWYRRFLYLVFKYPHKSIVVTKPIDEFWHQHILDTRKYAEDCNAIYGHFLHHFPYFGMRGDEDAKNLQMAFEETLELIETEYGESLLAAPISTIGARQPVGTEPGFWGSKCSDCSGPSPAGPGLMQSLERPTLPRA
jgi:hypothetical protein